jgi:ribosomal protein S18 acetylase RimI-like enzyme
MVSIRPYEDRDNARLLEIESLSPQGNKDVAMGVDKSPDAIGRYRLYDNYKILVAEEKGKVAGWIGWTEKFSEANKKYIYLVEVIIHPEFRRMGIATKLISEVEKYAQEYGYDYVCCFIFWTNEASKALFDKIGYSKIIEWKVCELSAYKEFKINEKYKIERINKMEIPDSVDLINNYYRGRGQFIPFTPTSFEYFLNKIPSFGSENFWVARENGKITACAGLWDSSIMQKARFTRMPLSIKIMRGVFGFLRIFTKMPTIPAEGEFFSSYYVAGIAFKDPDAMLNLMGHLNNLILNSKRDFYCMMLDLKDPMLKIVEKFQPQFNHAYIFAKNIKGKCPEFESCYVDIRDAIL